MVTPEVESPGGVALARPGLAQLGLGALGQSQQRAAAQGLHDPHGQVVLAQQLDLPVGVLELPVEEVELYLAELHVLAVGIEEAAEHRHRAVT